MFLFRDTFLVSKLTIQLTMALCLPISQQMYVSKIFPSLTNSRANMMTLFFYVLIADYNER